MARLDESVSEWKKLLCKLPSVINAEIKTDGDSVSEIHILAATDRSAKQISRDVQSALLAGFGLSVDHKTVSVAQIPFHDKLAYKGERLHFTGLDISFEGPVCTVSVRLFADDTTYSGTAKSDLTRAGRYRAIASATIAAINSYLAQDAAISPLDTMITDVGGRSVVLSTVVFKGGGVTQTLVGSCVEDENGGLSVVRAQLDAVNRRISIVK